MKRLPVTGRMARLSAAFLSLTWTAFACQTTVNATELPYQQKSITFQGKSDIVYGVVIHKTTYMPVWYVMQALKATGFQSTWRQNTWNITAPSGTTIDWSHLNIGSGQARLELNGKLVHRVIPVVRTDPNSGRPTTYMPIWYVMQMLQRAGITSTWNGRTWHLMLTSPTANSIWKVAFVTNSGSSLADIGKQLSGVNTLAASTYTVQQNGTLAGTPAAAVVSYAHTHAQRAIARIEANGKTVLQSILATVASRHQLAAQIARTIIQDGYDGVNVDFEFMPVADRTDFVSFLKQLRSQLSTASKTLSVDLPAIVDPAKETWNAGYDDHAIGQTANKVILMAYDYSYPTGQPGPIAPLWWVKETIQYAISQIPSQKVILGLDTYAYDWASNGSKAKAHSLSYIDQLLQSNHITPNWDSANQAPYFSYVKNGVNHKVYYESTRSLAPRIQLVKQDNLGGFSVWHADLEDASVARLLDGQG